MWAWIRQVFCFHKWEHLQTEVISNMKTQPPYFASSYRCTKCGKVKHEFT